VYVCLSGRNEECQHTLVRPMILLSIVDIYIHLRVAVGGEANLSRIDTQQSVDNNKTTVFVCVY
jgi:hypothetical protein